jgi:hypothetical protein
MPADAVAEWKLQSEPYLFVLDRTGIITATFEGPVSLAALDAALARVMSSSVRRFLPTLQVSHSGVPNVRVTCTASRRSTSAVRRALSAVRAAIRPRRSASVGALRTAWMRLR